MPRTRSLLLSSAIPRIRGCGQSSRSRSASASPAGESTAIASIVDTMLAELRPKLVEEIAKKMSSEKKDKEKEKEKDKDKKRKK